MKTNIQDYIVKTSGKTWEPLIEKGVHYKGVWVQSLLYNEEKGRSTTIKLKFEPGASYPYHNHPAGEEAFILEGEAYFNDAKLAAGDYLYTPPGFKHAVTSEKGCVIFFMIPEEVELL
jgi:quercetin dioxygenase-like cupin family protein